MSNTLKTIFILQPLGIRICQCLSRFLGYVAFLWPKALKLSVNINPRLRELGMLMISGSLDLTKVLFLTLPNVVFVMVCVCWLKGKEK